MLNDCCDTLTAVSSLEELLEETLRISEKILSQPIGPSPTLDMWNEEIEAENHYFTEKLSTLYKQFDANGKIIDQKRE